MNVQRRSFTNESAEDHSRRLVEVEVEPSSGITLATGERWSGVLVKARYPLRLDRRWTRGIIVGPLPDALDAAVEAVALRLLERR